MLVLSRRVTESIDIDGGIQISVLEIKGNRVKLAIQAPREVSIRRSELPRFSTAPETPPTPTREFCDRPTTALSSYVVDAVV